MMARGGQTAAQSHHARKRDGYASKQRQNRKMVCETVGASAVGQWQRDRVSFAGRVTLWGMLLRKVPDATDWTGKRALSIDSLHKTVWPTGSDNHSGQANKLHAVAHLQLTQPCLASLPLSSATTPLKRTTSSAVAALDIGWKCDESKRPLLYLPFFALFIADLFSSDAGCEASAAATKQAVGWGTHAAVLMPQPFGHFSPSLGYFRSSPRIGRRSSTQANNRNTSPPLDGAT